MATLLDIVHTLQGGIIYTNTLNIVHIYTDDITTGNNSVVCRCRLSDTEGDMLLKCYARRRRNGRAIYKSAFLSEEIAVFGMGGTIEYVDAVVLPWIDGTPLDHLFHRPTTDYNALSRSFEQLALATLCQHAAHGDIKPENIVVGSDGALHLIDFDGAWLPSFSDDDREETGSPTFCHPRQNELPFDKHIDDFPMAMVATMLAALAAKREEFEPHILSDNVLFVPQRVIEGTDDMLRRAIRLFERRGDVRHHALANSLYGCEGRIEGLEEMLTQE